MVIHDSCGLSAVRPRSAASQTHQDQQGLFGGLFGLLWIFLRDFILSDAKLSLGLVLILYVGYLKLSGQLQEQQKQLEQVMNALSLKKASAEL